MATGTVTAREPQTDSKTETTEACTPQPVTLKQRIVHLVHTIFERREEYLGWHQ
jgi:hypothetical protein